MTGTLHEKIYPARGHAFIAEFYGDLEYRPDGSLLNKGERPRVTGDYDAWSPE